MKKSFRDLGVRILGAVTGLILTGLLVAVSFSGNPYAAVFYSIPLVVFGFPVLVIWLASAGLTFVVEHKRDDAAASGDDEERQRQIATSLASCEKWDG
ncbi:MAG: hypothetical protein EOM26_10775 [Alphaproteobacteria bacterium]|nr:hypothetical protein [Alphaproteobacteria bacterium]